MPHAPEGMVYIYNGIPSRWSADTHVHLAKLGHNTPPVGEARPVLEPVQTALMVLPVSAKTRIDRKGHAGIPGMGPRGETCGSCLHLTRTRTRKKTFRKCALRRAEWTSAKGTDVRAKDPACGKWEAKNV